MKKKRRSGCIVLLVIVLLILALLIGLAVWQRENLKALYISFTKDSEDITQELEDTRNQQQAALENKYEITVTPPDMQQTDDLLNGLLTPEEVKDALGLPQSTPTPQPETTPQPGQPTPAPTPTPTPTPVPTPEPGLSQEEKQKLANDLVNQCVAELYACEVDLMARLGEMKAAAVAEWVALPKEQRTQAKKMEIGMAGLYACYDLEVEIDAQVHEILERYRKPLEDLGADTGILDELWKFYCEKKASQKAYYMDKYLD